MTFKIFIEKLKAKYPKFVEDSIAYKRLCEETDELVKEFLGVGK